MQWDDRIGRRLTLRDLNILLTVAELGSMARAAERLAVAPPVVSKAITELEQALGVRLLERSRAGITTTTAGSAIVARGLAAFDELRQGAAEVGFLSEPNSGVVHIGATDAMASGLLAHVASRICGRYPRIALEIVHVASSNDIVRLLRDRSVDFIVGRVIGEALDKNMLVERLFDDPVRVVAGLTSAWVKRRRIELAELAEEWWCISRAPVIRSMISNIFRDGGLDLPRMTVSVNSISAHTQLAATGQFLAMLPHSLLHFNATHLSLRVLPVPLMTRPAPVGIMTLKNRKLNPVADILIAEIRVAANPLAVRSIK